MDLYLIRHGEIKRLVDENDYFYRLTDVGKKSIKETGIFLKTYEHDSDGIILTSETLRTLESSIILSEILRTKIKIVPNSHEMNMGYNEAKDKKDWLYVYNGEFTDRSGFDYTKKWETKHYLGESPREVYERLKGLKEYIISLKEDNVYVVGHGTSLRMLDMNLNEHDLNWYYNEPIPKYASVRKLVLNKNYKVVSDKYIRS